MFSKRPDKHTTGLINLRNDCFANSSLQAYLALPKLTEYLNQFIGTFSRLERFVHLHQIDVSTIVHAKLKRTPSSDSIAAGAANSKFKSSNAKFGIPLHRALAETMLKLQETRMSSHTISAWNFLHVLESIFLAKISRSQHDAQELTQLINETLEHENLKAKAFLKAITENLHILLPNMQTPGPKEYADIASIQFPDFPINGLILTQMKCTHCLGVSKPQLAPFSMLTLHAPQDFTADLESLLDENRSESIDGYQCLRCRVAAIVEWESKNGQTAPSHIMEQLQVLAADTHFCINEDLNKELEAYISSYKQHGFDISECTSTVLRTNQILKPPKIFGLHLSRSSFNGVLITRNSCRVLFKQHLKLLIGKDYRDELKLFSLDHKLLTASIDASRVLTTDAADMEDEDVQVVDIDETGADEEDDDDEDAFNLVNELAGMPNSSETDLDLDAGSHAGSHATVKGKESGHSLAAKHASSSDGPSAGTASDTLGQAPISDTQTKDLRKHFGQFEFNDNDNYRYRLRAVIKHIGSHTQGHYECYKKKPLFVKDKDGNIFKLLPEISVEERVAFEPVQEEDEDRSSAVSGAVEVPAASPSNLASKSAPPSSGRSRGFSLSRSGSLRRKLAESDDSKLSASPSLGPIDSANTHLSSSSHMPQLSESAESANNSGFRAKLSNMVNRKTEVIQANPRESNIQEITRSGTATPSELLVNCRDDYFAAALSGSALDASAETTTAEKVKLRKIPSRLAKPYWRISDAAVTEVPTEQVLLETSNVYMLYYERVDRTQIKATGSA